MDQTPQCKAIANSAWGQTLLTAIFNVTCWWCWVARWLQRDHFHSPPVGLATTEYFLCMAHLWKTSVCNISIYLSCVPTAFLGSMVSRSTSPFSDTRPDLSHDVRKYLRRFYASLPVQSSSEPVCSVSICDHCKKALRDPALLTLQASHKVYLHQERRRANRNMRTVSEDDELVQRAANPRTGVISPFVTRYGSEESAGIDYLAVSKHRIGHQKGRAPSSECGKQEGSGRSFVGDTKPSPIDQNIELGPQEPDLAGQLLNEDLTNPLSKDKFTSNGEAKASPLIRIARKAVGSGLRPRNHTPSPENDSAQRTRKELTRAQLRNEDITGNPFLGRLMDSRGDPRPTIEVSDTDIKPSASMRLSHYLPRLEFLHSSHIANPERSYRRPAHLLPPKLWNQHQALTNHTAFAPMPQDENTHQQRPHIRRQDGNISVPQAAGESGNHAFARNPQVIKEIRAKLRPSQLCKCSKCLGPRPSVKKSKGKTTICSDDIRSEEMDNDSVGTKCQADSDQPSCDLTRTKSVFRRIDSMTTLFSHLPDTRWVTERLLEMVGHVYTTLHHASPALQVLRSPQNARIDKYARALKQVFLAGVYLLVLLNLVVLLARAVQFIFRIVAVVGWPVRVLWLTIRWALRG